MNTGEVLFGTKLQPVNLTELSRVTGICASTLSDYKKEPGKIPLYRLCMIVEARGLDDEQIAKALRAYRGKR